MPSVGSSPRSVKSPIHPRSRTSSSMGIFRRPTTTPRRPSGYGRPSTRVSASGPATCPYKRQAKNSATYPMRWAFPTATGASAESTPSSTVRPKRLAGWTRTSPSTIRCSSHRSSSPRSIPAPRRWWPALSLGSPHRWAITAPMVGISRQLIRLRGRRWRADRRGG